jgi:hypothetical protein
MNSELDVQNLENVVNDNIIIENQNENDEIETGINNTINNKTSISWSKIDEDDNKDDNISNKSKNNLKTMGYFVFVFTLLWFITGLLGWLMSIYCFKYNKTKIENVVGVLIAILLGPFYWLYYIYMQNYCGK